MLQEKKDFFNLIENEIENDEKLKIHYNQEISNNIDELYSLIELEEIEDDGGYMENIKKSFNNFKNLVLL